MDREDSKPMTLDEFRAKHEAEQKVIREQLAKAVIGELFQYGSLPRPIRRTPKPPSAEVRFLPGFDRNQSGPRKR